MRLEKRWKLDINWTLYTMVLQEVGVVHGKALLLMQDRATTNAVMKKHLEQPLGRNSTYLSPRSQKDDN